MRNQLSRALVAAAVGLGLAACGGAPADDEPTGASDSALTLAPIRQPLAPWITSSSGTQVRWIDASGNPTSNVTLTYKRAAGTVQHTGTLGYTVWDDVDKTAPSENCFFNAYVSAISSAGQGVLVAPTGPILCDGTPYFGDMLPSYPYRLDGDLLAAAFSEAAGDSVPDVCTATNGHGKTLRTTFTVSIAAGGETVSTAKYDWTWLTSSEVIALNVTLVCG